jgi:D-serine deaminase-like pyridoxal phosphate-dependent protein
MSLPASNDIVTKETPHGDQSGVGMASGVAPDSPATPCSTINVSVIRKRSFARRHRAEDGRIFDHHAVCELPSSKRRPRIGDVDAIVPNHICLVINLARHVVVASHGRKVGDWSVVAHA